MCGFNDLIAVVTGNAYTEGGEVLPIYKQYSEGRTKHEIGKIDLFIWLDDFKPSETVAKCPLFSKADVQSTR